MLSSPDVRLSTTAFPRIPKSLVRILVLKREARRHHDVALPEALVVARANQRTIDSGRFDFQRIVVRLGAEGGVEIRRNPLAQGHIHTARTIERQRQFDAAAAAARALRDDFDISEFRLRRYSGYRRLEGLD